MWRSYLGIKDSRFFPASGLENGNILDFYHGGWQELFTNAGTVGIYKGAKFPFLHDMAYVYGFDDGLFVITNKKLKVGFGLRWDKEIFKYMWYWQSFSRFKDYPFYSTTYNIRLEPQSSYPQGIENAIKNKTNLKLEPSKKLATNIQAIVYESDSGISSIDKEGSIKLKN